MGKRRNENPLSRSFSPLPSSHNPTDSRSPTHYITIEEEEVPIQRDIFPQYASRTQALHSHRYRTLGLQK